MNKGLQQGIKGYIFYNNFKHNFNHEMMFMIIKMKPPH